MKALIAIISIAVSVGIFFWYIEPAWANINLLQSQISQYQNEVTQAQQAKNKLNQLESTYNTLTTSQTQELGTFLPTNINPITFALSLNTIAAQYGSGLSSISIGKPAQVSGQIFSTLPVTFSVSMTYTNFLLFLKDLERSLPPTDVTSLSFKAPVNSATYTFTVSVQTYYL